MRGTLIKPHQQQQYELRLAMCLIEMGPRGYSMPRTSGEGGSRWDMVYSDPFISPVISYRGPVVTVPSRGVGGV